MFQREDWTLFRNLGTLSQKAGVPLHKLRRLVVKELVDNALDAFGGVRFGKTPEGAYWVEDDGPGIPGDAEDIARLFSVARPLTSTKIVRLPVRGALGNGLRVVVGAALASGGDLKVTTRGRFYHLKPLDDGTTRVLRDEPSSRKAGTRVEITLLEGVPEDAADLVLGELAQSFSFAETYKGRTSAWWYDSDSFYELLRSAGETPVGGLVDRFDGWGKVGQRVPASVSRCNDLDRDEAEQLLKALREGSKPVPRTRIGSVGNPHGKAYGKVAGTLTVRPGRGSLAAELPYVVEAWATARKDDRDDGIIAYVNGTPVVGEMTVRRDKPTKIAVFGCGLKHYIERVSPRKAVIQVNVTIPYMPITTDGKEPDFARLLEPLGKAIGKATRQLKSNIRREENPASQTEVILDCLPDATANASGNGRYRFSLRQLYYSVRPHCLDAGHPNLAYGHFCKTITDYEAGHGEIPGMYRDPRGTLYHPHLRRSIPIGTLSVEEYERPEWTFNKILYCEKEGLTHLLISDGWPERNDCALLSSKGFASRAVRDVLDYLGETAESLTFFCVHDADASGGMIYQALQEATTARAARKVRIINLGLDPWEAVEMGLQVEEFRKRGDARLPVADYVTGNDTEAPDGRPWRSWLQGNRVELNAMTSPQFIAWLDEKLSRHVKKVVPPHDVLRHRLEADVRDAVERQERERILREAGLADLVSRRMESISKSLERNITTPVQDGLEENPSQQWTGPVRRLAEAIAGRPPRPGSV